MPPLKTGNELNSSKINSSGKKKLSGLIPAAKILAASHRLQKIMQRTPLMENINLSKEYDAHIYLKREDLQIVRSYKLRGAYNKMSQLSEVERGKGVICASAGNHAQGFAYSCNKLGISGKVFMPATTPLQKVKQVKMFGGGAVEIVLIGDTFDDAFNASMLTCKEQDMVFIHPFDDRDVIAGQGTVGMEILQDCPDKIDYVFVPIGGGGLSAGLGSYFKQLSPETKIIGVEPKGAPAMKTSLNSKKVVCLNEIDKFVDGAAVAQVGNHTFEICKEVLDDVVLIPEGKVCSTILKLYDEEAIVAEPAGALAISALDEYKSEIKGKNIVTIVSGSNNDIMRMEEIKERSLLYEGLKHYFIISFPQRAGALKEFLQNVLGPNDDITQFGYTKKNNRGNAPALVGIELRSKEDLEPLMGRMEKYQVNYQIVNDNPDLFDLLV